MVTRVAGVVFSSVCASHAKFLEDAGLVGAVAFAIWPAE